MGLLPWIELTVLINFKIDRVFISLFVLIVFFDNGLEILLNFFCFFHWIVFNEFESLDIVHLLFKLFFPAVRLFLSCFYSDFAVVLAHHLLLLVVDKGLFLLFFVVHETMIFVIHFLCLCILVYGFSPSFEGRLKWIFAFVCFQFLLVLKLAYTCQAGVFQEATFLWQWNIQHFCLLSQTIQVNVIQIHVADISSLKRISYVLFSSGFDKRFIDNFSDRRPFWSLFLQ